MKKVLEKLEVTDVNQLVHRLIGSGYSFAAWRMPNEDLEHLIISLRGMDRITDLNLGELPTGFLLNAFDDSHPISPYYIPADIELEENRMKVHPVVNDSQLDRFQSAMQLSIQDSPIKRTSIANQANYASSSDFIELVEKSIQKIEEGYFEKVVVSRFKDEPLAETFDIWEYFQRICKKYQNAFCSLTFIPDQGLWIGASPELLISESGQRFKTVALASTKKLQPDQELSEIAWTQKEIEEQAFVSRYIINCFKKLRLREFHEYGPKSIKAGNLAHLKTIFEVKYDEVQFEKLGDQMLNLLHPTSAVCGMPIDHAKPWILANERYSRELYAGFLGPVNYDGESNLFVNLRCAKVEHGIIRFYAGAGITEDSVPEREFQETEMKIDVLRKLLLDGKA